MDTQYGAMLVFHPDATKEQLDAFFKMMIERNIIDVNHSNVEPKEFEPEYGYPTFYIP